MTVRSGTIECCLNKARRASLRASLLVRDRQLQRFDPQARQPVSKPDETVPGDEGLCAFRARKRSGDGHGHEFAHRDIEIGVNGHDDGRQAQL